MLVLGFRAAEIAEMLDTTEVAVHRLISTRANGQPAFGGYLKDPHTPIAHAYALMVLTLRGDRVAAWPGSPTPRCSRPSGFRGR